MFQAINKKGFLVGLSLLFETSQYKNDHQILFQLHRAYEVKSVQVIDD